ncbi:MAG: hypothetical protein ACQESW_02360 [Bacteroidota bacterium]
MKKRTYYLILILLIPFVGNAQETENNKPTVDIGGFVRYEAFFDTYKSVDTRDGDVYLYPRAENLDIDGNDIHKNRQFEMLSLQSRFYLTLGGIDAFGAKTSGKIEVDFAGTAQAYARMLRVRHAFMKFQWEKAELLLGQTWHPMFVTACFPATISFGAGVPFHPLNRAPQARYTYYLNTTSSVMGAMLVHGYHRSVGPSDAQRNAGLPDFQFQYLYAKGETVAGFTAGYKFLKPRLETATGRATDEMIGSYNLEAFAKLPLGPVTLKLEGIYGQNLTSYVMIGGYGATENPLLTDDYSYQNIHSYSLWADLSGGSDKVGYGIFGGLSGNLGAEDTYYSVGYGRGEDLDKIFRISPRATFTSNNVMFALEYILTGAIYGENFNEQLEVTETADATLNHRLLFSAKYSF